jgi:hypothetical protein
MVWFEMSVKKEGDHMNSKISRKISVVGPGYDSMKYIDSQPKSKW